MSALDPLPDDARMGAYYYSFERTGVGAVDAILSAMAVAGKGSHHTDGWTDVAPYDYYKGRPGLPDGESAVDLIQQTANRSAEQVRELAARLEDARWRLHQADWLVAVSIDGHSDGGRAHGDEAQPPCPDCRALMEHAHQILSTTPDGS